MSDICNNPMPRPPDPDVTSALAPFADRINDSRQFLTRLWNLDNDERPGFLISPPLEESVKNTNLSSRLLDKEHYLQDAIRANAGILRTGSDFVPFLNPNIGVVAVPSAFGCQVEWWENDWPATRPVISDPTQVYALQKPDVRAGVMGLEIETLRYWLERTGGSYPVGLADCQGPLDIASMLLGQNNFLLALYSFSREMHYLLQLVNEAIIEFIQAQRDLAKQYGAEFVATIDQPWASDGQGVDIAHDDNILISPAMHDEFAVPYLNQISEAFGGISLHSCGRFAHNLGSFEKIYRLRRLEFGASEAPYLPVLEHFNGKIVLSMRIGLNRDICFSSLADFVRSVRHASRTNRGLYFCIYYDISDVIRPKNWSESGLEEIYAALK